MLYKKQGLPEVGELVMCTVKKILPHSIFVDIEEYKMEGMIHISEIAPGRIRNLRDHVREGKQIVCKALNIYKEKGHVDLSLRRVNQSQRIKKVTEYKQEQKAEKILENAAKELKISLEEIYKQAGNLIIEKYGALTPCFYEVVRDEVNLKDLKIPLKIEKVLTEKIKDKIQIPSVSVSSIVKLQSFSGNGIEDIKKTLKHIANYQASLSYLGAPNYKLIINAPDYKEAELVLKKITDSTTKLAKELNVKVDFKRK
ncbi:translation initiation factor IF-2 subunit alpha [Candidatus Woesearchaeota archaeon]|nr:translation initiation factor IF-2 subunit alpha [Candidatus Woesearchaeota archaeon]